MSNPLSSLACSVALITGATRSIGLAIARDNGCASARWADRQRERCRLPGRGGLASGLRLRGRVPAREDEVRRLASQVLELLLAAPGGAFISGQSIIVDGGTTIGDDH